MTSAQHRALLLGASGAVAAVLTRRLDLLVLATPMLVLATWGLLSRPREPVQVGASVGNRTFPEGSATHWRAQLALPPRTDEVTVRLSPGMFVTVDPDADLRSTPRPDGGDLQVAIAARATRWGPRRIGPGLIQARSPWWAWRTPVIEVGAFPILATPAATAFDRAAPTPHPDGLVGVNRSPRPGSGSEFDSIRAWQPGDRLRLVHWPVTLREGSLHVRTTYADQDAHVVLVVDAIHDLGPREGLDGRPTSLDLTVRATAALAAHWLATGDRVSLRILGATGVPRLAPRSGVSQLRRITQVLAQVSPATDRHLDTLRSLDGLTRGSLVVVLSPLMHPDMAGVVSATAARGLTTVAVDTLPAHLGADAHDEYANLAWRIRRLERREQIHQLSAAGVPVIPWLGPGSLDVVLRDLTRRQRHPRLVRR